MQSQEELIDLFILRVSGAGAKVLRALNREQLKKRILNIVQECNARRVGLVVSDGLVHLQKELETLNVNVVTASERAGEVRREVMDIDVGICEADLGVAETGTLAVFSKGEESRLVTATPKVHIAALRESTIIHGFRELTPYLLRALNDGYSVSFITGPSKTADIEFKLVEGVHGPHILYVIIFGEGFEKPRGGD